MRDKMYRDQELIQGKFIPVDNDDGDVDIEDTTENMMDTVDVKINDMQPIVIAPPKRKSNSRTTRRTRNRTHKYFCQSDCKKKGHVNEGK